MILAIYGAGAIGREFALFAGEEGKWERIVFVVDEVLEKEILGCTVYEMREFRKTFPADEDGVRFLVAMGEPSYKRKAFERMKRAGYTGAVVIHPEARVFPDTVIGEGSFICPGVYMGSLAKAGSNFYAGFGASIGHDTVIGDYVRIGENAFVGGHTVIGDSAYIGSRAVLKDRITIGAESVAALGSVVFSDVGERSTVIGNPARVVDDDRSAYVFASKSPEGDKDDKKKLEECYWEVFASCFDGIDFNPVSFHYHDYGWDSLMQMQLVSRLEEAFSISIKGHDIMRIKSYRDGLELVLQKKGY